jgi:cysteine desulfurase
MLRACRSLRGPANPSYKPTPAPAFATRSLYLDNQATSPVDPRVLDAMMPYFTDRFGNAHSRTHMYGWQTEEAVESARKKIANVINADPKEIIFTSGATESNNIALKGVADFAKDAGKNHIITLVTEHKCVLDSCRWLEARGTEVTYVPVQKDGLVNLEELEKAIRPGKTCLVSIMYAHNEIGVIQDIPAIGKLCRSKGILLHTDAAQAFGKIPVDVNKNYIDLMSISGHKIYAPKGIGALYVRRRPRVRLRSPISGGGQERGIRSGTLAVPLIVGLGAASEIAINEMERDEANIRKLVKKFWQHLNADLPHLQLNGHAEKRLPGNLNISFKCVEGESLLMGIKSVAVSSGSACTSASLEPSYVLRALGVDPEVAHTSIRFGIGRFTTEKELEHTANVCIREVRRLREMSPLWDDLLEAEEEAKSGEKKKAENEN